MALASLRFPGVSRESAASVAALHSNPVMRGIGGLWTYIDARDADLRFELDQRPAADHGDQVAACCQPFQCAADAGREPGFGRAAADRRQRAIEVGENCEAFGAASVLGDAGPCVEQVPRHASGPIEASEAISVPAHR